MEELNECLSDEEASNEIEKNKKEAEELLKSTEKTETFLTKLENYLKKLPCEIKLPKDKKIRIDLSLVPELIGLVRSYIRKEYTAIPVGSIIAILSALIYVLAPIDLIPDTIPVLGVLDDVAVISSLCTKFVKYDLDKYMEWKKNK